PSSTRIPARCRRSAAPGTRRSRRRSTAACRRSATKHGGARRGAAGTPGGWGGAPGAPPPPPPPRRAPPRRDARARGGGGGGLLRTERELRDEGWELAGSTFTRDGQRMLPVYESPMIGLFDHEVAAPRHWIAEHGPVAIQRKGETAERPGVADRLAELGWNWG